MKSMKTIMNDYQTDVSEELSPVAPNYEKLYKGLRDELHRVRNENKELRDVIKKLSKML